MCSPLSISVLLNYQQNSKNWLEFMNLISLLLAFFGGLFASGRTSDVISFNQNYYVTWGYDHVWTINQGREVQLSLDYPSGAGFGSKQSYGSGFFYFRMKLPDMNSAGVVTAFYLTSHGHNHDELDFEFLGNNGGNPIYISTNVFANGLGGREQRFSVWFDPTTDFHTYQILWNLHQIVFYVDDIPIRVFKNLRRFGVNYLLKPMQIESSLWNASWATDGGQTQINWSYAPFQAYYQGFDIAGCSIDDDQRSNTNHRCYASHYWWNEVRFWELDSNQRFQYQRVRRLHMVYDYCSDTHRYPTPPRECQYN